MKISGVLQKTTNLLVVLFTSVICFGICEIALRIATPDWLDYRMNILKSSGQIDYGTDAGSTAEMNHGVFYRFTPHSQFPISHPEYHNEVHIDELGGRRVSSDDQMSKTTILPVYGDSFTFGIGVEDDETFVSHLAKKSDKRWLNLGVPGSAIHNHLDTLMLRHHELGDPKTIIFAFFIGNDFADLINAYEKKTKQDSVNQDKTQAEINDSIIKKMNAILYHNILVKNSYFLQFIRSKLILLMNGKKLAYANPIFKIMQDNTEYTEAAQIALFEQLDRLSELKDKYHFNPLIIIIPDRYQIDAEARNYQGRLYGLAFDSLYPNRPNSLLINALNERSISYIDASSCLSQYHHEKLYYIQDDHFTALGQYRFAECIQARLPDFIQ